MYFLPQLTYNEYLISLYIIIFIYLNRCPNCEPSPTTSAPSSRLSIIIIILFRIRAHRRNNHWDLGKQVPQLLGWGTSNVLAPLNFLVNLNFQYVHVVCVNVIYFKSFFVSRSTHRHLNAFCEISTAFWMHCKSTSSLLQRLRASPR